MVVNSELKETRSDLKTVFQGINANSCPGSFNFHMHTVYSDGQLQPEALIQQAIALGVQGLAITDHHTTRGFQVAQAWLESGKAQTGAEATPTLWAGVEITAELLETEVHILGYAFDASHPLMQPYLQGRGAVGTARAAGQVIKAIQQSGGLAVLAHPARYRRSPVDLIPVAAGLGLDGVETFYCYTNPPVWQPSPQQTALVQELATRYGLLQTCGTDTHGVNLRQRL